MMLETHTQLMIGVGQCVQLHAGNIELSIVGDIDLEEAQQLVLKYAGTIPPVDVPAEPERPVVLQNPLGSGRHQVWHLKVGWAPSYTSNLHTCHTIEP